MASVASRTNPLISSLPYILTWRGFGFRTICSGRLSFAPSTSSTPAESEIPVAGTKILETFTEEFEIGSRKITFETGKIARFANGAVVIAMDETKVLSTVASAKGDSVTDFLPLTVRSLHYTSAILLFKTFILLPFDKWILNIYGELDGSYLENVAKNKIKMKSLLYVWKFNTKFWKLESEGHLQFHGLWT